MERLIDGSFLEDRCKRQKSDEWNKKAAPSSWADAYEQFLTDIENCPTVDAVEVVRCKECKWWKTNYLWNGTERKVCVIESYEPCRKPDDYCSRGERKGGDER